MAGGAVLALFATLALAHEGATGVVKERMDLMKGQQEDMKLLGDMAKGKVPFESAKAAAAARDLNTTAKKIADLFPEGSNGHPSDALPAICRFKGNANDLETSADALASSFDGAGDKDWKAAPRRPTFASPTTRISAPSKRSTSITTFITRGF